MLRTKLVWPVAGTSLLILLILCFRHHSMKAWTNVWFYGILITQIATKLCLK